MRWTAQQYNDYVSKNPDKPKKKSKYRNVKAMVDNIPFDSKAEAKFYLYLKACGYKIELQPKFELQATFIDNVGKKRKAITYKADFQIGNVVIDVKGFRTDVFNLKEKLFREKYPQYELWVGKYSELILKVNLLKL
jgi:hypothetical protein